MPDNEIGELVASIKAKRKALGISVMDIAEWEGIKPRTMYNWLKGLCLSDYLPYRPGRRTLRRILRLLVKIETGGASSDQDVVPMGAIQENPKARAARLLKDIKLGAREYGVTYNAIADYIGVSIRSFQYWAAGEKEPSIENYTKLLEVKQLLFHNPEALKVQYPLHSVHSGYQIKQHG